MIDQPLDFRTDIALIKKDISQIEKMLGKLDNSLDVVAGITKAMAVQDRIIMEHESRLADVDEKQTRRIREQEEFQKELQKQLTELRESHRKHIEELQASNRAERDARHKEVLKSIDDLREELKQTNKEQDEKIAALENWKWWVMGVGVTVTTILTLVWKTVFG
jgi:predicted RNase H-like nuclease (RuvC/YqgF family)